MYFYRCDIIDIDKLKKDFNNFYLLTKADHGVTSLMNSITHVETIYSLLTNVDPVGLIYYSYNENSRYLNLLVSSNKPIDVFEHNYLYRVTDTIIKLEKYRNKKYRENRQNRQKNK